MNIFYRIVLPKRRILSLISVVCMSSIQDIFNKSYTLILFPFFFPFSLIEVPIILNTSDSFNKALERRKTVITNVDSCEL